MAINNSPQLAATPAWLRTAKAYGPWLLGLALVALGILGLARKLALAPDWPNSTDLMVYLTAAGAILRGDHPYHRELYLFDPYGYPPLFAFLIAGLRRVFDMGHGWYLWAAASIAAVFAFTAMLLRGFGPKLSWGWVVLAAGVIIFGHIGRSDLFHGQPGFWLVTLFVFGLMQFRAGKDWSGAVAWALMIVCKPFLGVIVIYLLRRGAWTAAFKTMGAAALLFIAPFLAFGANAVNAFQGWLSATHWYTSIPNVAKPGNQSLNGFLIRLFSENPFTTPWIDAPTLIPVLMALALPAFALGIYLSVDGQAPRAQTPPSEGGGQDLLQATLIFGFIFAYGPLTEAPHMFLLLPALMGCGIILARRVQERAATVRPWTYAFIAWCITLSIFAIPFRFILLAPYAWGHLDGAQILLSFECGATALIASVLSVAALQADRRVRGVAVQGAPA